MTVLISKTFSCFSFFNQKNLTPQNSWNLLKCNTNRALPPVISTHEKTNRVILINLEALNASQRRTLVFSRTTRLRKILTIS